MGFPSFVKWYITCIWCFMAGLLSSRWDWNWTLHKKQDREQTRIWKLGRFYSIRTHKVYGSISSYQNLMNLFLYEARHLKLSKHINYKAIGIVLREIWIFEINHRILSLVLSRLDFDGHVLPYTHSNWVQLIFFRNLRHRVTFHKNFITKFNSCSSQ